MTKTTLVCALVALGALCLVFATGCPKATTETEVVAPPAEPPAPEAAGTVSEETEAPPTEAVPENIGNAKNADGEYLCPVSGEVIAKLDKELSAEHEGKVYYFCCAGCPDTFNADPAKYAEIAAEEEVPDGGEATEAEEHGETHEGHDH